MITPLKSANEYREQADRLRLKASMAGTSDTREILTQLASDYDLLAESVASLQRSRKRLAKSPPEPSEGAIDRALEKPH